MAVRQYIGARYVPIFGRRGEDSIEWDNTGTYEPLTVVLYQGNSYTSRQFVPVGIDITNEDFWAETGNYNAQIEQYRQEVLGFDERITQNASDIDTLEGQMAGTSTSALKSAIEQNASDIDTLEGQMAGTSESGLKEAIEGVSSDLTEATESIGQSIEEISGDLADEVAARESSDQSFGTSIAKLNERTERMILGGTVLPSYLGSYEGDEQHASCVRVGNEMYTFSPNNYDGNGTARIWSITSNSLNQKKTILMGHGNSAAYDTVRNCIWIAPMGTYINGVSTETTVLYKYALDLNSHTTLNAPERIYGVSFDPTTRTLYAFNTTNGTNQIRVYKMGPEDSTLSLLATVVNDQFAQQGASGDILWQDFAVYDGVAFFTKVDGTCYVVNLYAEIPDVTGTIRVSRYDAGGLWQYGELEGMEFDAVGRLYSVFTCNCGFTNTGANCSHAVGFVTELNTERMAQPQDCCTLLIYGTITLQPETVFGVPRAGSHSLNELMWRRDSSWNNVLIPSTLTHTVQKFRVFRDVCIRVQGVLVVGDTIEINAGNFLLYVDGGRVTFNTGASGNCIQNSSRAGSISLRCRDGNIVNTNDANMVATGFAPTLVMIGILDNVSTIKVNTYERSDRTICMGSFVVWSYGS